MSTNDSEPTDEQSPDESDADKRDNQSNVVSDRPTLISAGVALGMGTLAVLAIGVVVPPALVAGLPGLAVLGLGAVRGGHQAVSVGALVLFLAVILGAFIGAPVPLVLIATIATVLAWDAGQYGIGMGKQLGRESDTLRPEVVHTASSVGVGVVVVALALPMFAIGSLPMSVFSLVVTVAGTLALVIALE